ncbi:13000_t:CDS:1, partial [Funneliformis caledonium]
TEIKEYQDEILREVCNASFLPSRKKLSKDSLKYNISFELNLAVA